MTPILSWWNPMTWAAPFPVVAAALFVIVSLRAGATYAVGRVISAGGTRTRFARWRERTGVAAAVDRINRVGAPAVSLSFLTIGVQTMVNLAAGLLRMPLSRYLPALAVGATMWALVYASVGFVGLRAFVLAWEQHPALAIGLALLFVAGSVWFVRRQLRVPAAD